MHCVIHRQLNGTVKTITISKNTDGKYYASILVDDGLETPEANAEGKAIGLDVGLIDFVVTSDGSKYANPKHLKKHSRNLKRKQKKLSRKQKGSNTRHKAKKSVARVHSKIKRTREDFLHKLSRAAVATTGGTPATHCLKIVNENQVIAVENLNVKGMVSNHCLAKAISDAGWGMFGTMLEYKAEKLSKIYIEIDRFFPSSKTCNNCLHKVSEMPLNLRHWDCPSCHSRNDRDINAAKNIRDEALRIIALGTSASANGRNVSQPGKTSVLLDAVPVEFGSPRHSGTPLDGG